MFRILVLALLTTGPLRPQADLIKIQERINSVPRPEVFLGYELGDRHTSTMEAIRYAHAVAAASDRVTVTALGPAGVPDRTDSGLPLVRVIVTRPGRDLDAIAALTTRIRGGQGTPPEDFPVTTWFTMSIHGNEASAVEAGIAILYNLAASNDADARQVLDNVVLHLELVSNPDGRERFVQGVRDRKSRFGPRRHRQAWDHREAWPGGRTNHYLFDLNRDWFLQTQTESRIRGARLQKVMPQVLCDFHEMGTDRTYYFSAPAAMPTNHHFTPEVRSSQKSIGQSIGSLFDGFGWPYWTGDTFPADYPGYGGSWPCLCGAAGFTFEQAGARAGVIPRLDGSTHTLREASQRHAGAGIAVLRHCAAHREQVLGDWVAHFERVRKDGARDSLPWFVFTPRRDSALTQRLGRTLVNNGIEVQQLVAPMTLDAVPLEGGATASRTLAAGSLLVSTRQPLRQLLLALCDPTVSPEKAFVEAESRRRLHGEPSEVYDVSAWNLPLLFGVESFRAATLAADARLAPLGQAAPPVHRRDENSIAWLVPGRSVTAASRLTKLLERDIRVRVIPFPFTIEERTFEPGTLLVLRDRNPPAAVAAAVTAAATGHHPMIGVKTLATSVGYDLGSGRTIPVKKPEIIVLTGPGTSAYSAGAVWWLFEHPFEIPHTRVGPRDLAAALEDANVLVLPDGRHADLDKEILEDFLDRKGTIISLRGATARLVDLGLLALKRRDGHEDLGSVAGVIVRTELTDRHWLGHGLSTAPAMQIRTRDYWTAGTGVSTVLSCARQRLHLSGLLTEDQKAALLGTPLLVEARSRRGRIIAFTEDPVFRGTSPGAWRFFLNSVLLGPSHL